MAVKVKLVVKVRLVVKVSRVDTTLVRSIKQAGITTPVRSITIPLLAAADIIEEAERTLVATLKAASDEAASTANRSIQLLVQLFNFCTVVIYDSRVDEIQPGFPSRAGWQNSPGNPDLHITVSHCIAEKRVYCQISLGLLKRVF